MASDEPSTPPPAPPFPADEARRATATTDSFLFQWWQSALAWLELKDTETLYVESAEDFETVTAAAGTATQVKAGTSSALTLRSPAFVESVNHAWELVQQDKRAIKFVLLTRAEAGREQGDWFEPEIKGAELWMTTARTGSITDAEKLGRFLATDSGATKLNPVLKEFLRSATGAEILERLVRIVSIDFSNQNSTSLRAHVQDRLITLTVEQVGATVPEAEALTPSILEVIITHASSKERRPLTRAALLKKVDAETLQRRAHILTALGSGLRPALEAALGIQSGAVVTWATSATLSVPTLPGLVAERADAVETISSDLNQTKTVFLHGSTGMGKTTLAKLTARKMGGDWTWIDLQDSPAGSQQGILRQTVRLLDQHRDKDIGVVIDGLAPEELSPAAASSLRGLLSLLTLRGSKVIVTQQRKLAPSELASLGCGHATELAAPPMTSAEISRLAESLGCSDPKQVNAWGIVILARTGGHPQLVQAALFMLQRSGWPTISLDSLNLTTEGVRDEQSQALRLLADLKGDTLELLTRLAVMGGTFRRDHALAMAAAKPALGGGAVRFTELLGPWIEGAGSTEYFRVSNLIDPDSLVTAQRYRDLLLASAVIRVRTPVVHTHDASHALQNAVTLEEGYLIAEISAKVMMIPTEHRSGAFGDFLWMTWLHPETCRELFAKFPAVESFFRLLQFMVAAELTPDRSLPFFKLAQVAISRLDPETAQLQEFILLSEALFRLSVPWKMADRFAAIERFAELAGGMDAEYPVKRWLPDEAMPQPVQNYSASERVAVGMVGTALVNLSGRDQLEDLIQWLDSLPPERRGQVIAPFIAWPSNVILAFDKSWVEDTKQPNVDWEKEVARFQKIKEIALKWPSLEFAIAAARAASVICNEYLNDSVRASEILETVPPLSGPFRAFLDEQQGKILAEQKNYAGAVGALRLALAKWEQSYLGIHNKLFAYHRGGAWAGKAGLWKEAADFFLSGAMTARAAKLPIREAGFLTDGGYSRWEAGEKSQALEHWDAAIALGEGMVSPTTDLAVFQCQKMLSFILGSLANRYRPTPGSNYPAAIIPGLASDIELRDSIKESPEPRLDSCKALLVTLEFNYDLGDRWWQKWREQLLASPWRSCLQFAGEVGVRRAISGGIGGDLPRVSSKVSRLWGNLSGVPKVEVTTANLRELDFISPANHPPVPFDNPLCGRDFFMCALIGAVGLGKDPVEFLMSCEGRADESPFAPELRKWCHESLQTLAFDESTASEMARRGEDPVQRVIAALSLATRPNPHPVSLWVGLYVTMAFLLGTFWLFESLDLLDRRAGQLWLQLAEKRALFRSPTLFIPDLKEAARRPVSGMRRIAEMLLLIAPALDVHPGTETFERLKAISAGSADYLWKSAAPRRYSQQTATN